MIKPVKTGWYFIDEEGSFALDEPQKNSYLYFPLTNEAGMMSSITPDLKGDIKTSQNSFFACPVSADDLHNIKSGRNFWVYIHGKGAWSAAGSSSRQISENFRNVEEVAEKVRLEAGLLWHKIIRENTDLGLKAEVTSYVPSNEDHVELMKIVITNTGDHDIKLTPTAAIPVYGRSADNIRDHRHVTGLLNRTYTSKYGVEVQPAMTFDERGHKVNKITYGVYGADENGDRPKGVFADMEEFIGEGGCLEWPEVIVRNLDNFSIEGGAIEGFEAIGGIRFEDTVLSPGKSKGYVVVLSVNEDKTSSQSKAMKYLKGNAFDKYLAENINFWKNKLSKVNFKSSESNFDQWMQWVTLQPVLRRIYGCSFMPHHDYGKGGRGWRDLWQDCLALLLMEPDTVRNLLYNNFGGVRLDGTNATIIGSKPGEFVADRNNISRVWSDHGVWPFFTTFLYINQSGDIEFLLEKQSYFKDKLVRRSREVDSEWSPEYGRKQKQLDSQIYQGTIIEHILLQNLTAFFNVGEHNNIRLENADWNDGLDMAYDKGETVAFTSFYAGNLMEISSLLLELKRLKGTENIEIAAELTILLDSLNKAVNYDSVEEKRKLLSAYYETCSHNISGEKKLCSIEEVSTDLQRKALWLMENIRKNEWLKNSEGFEWFNGYYDNSGKKVEGDFEKGIRMTLTGQVFPVMTGVADREHIQKVIESVNKYLFDRKLGGYRLNTNFGEVKLDMGRCFGFAFGHKENGAMFSHMAVMYAYALYKQGFVNEGYNVLNTIYNLSSDFDKAHIYPGIPEYINEKGRGVYHYLTGSASWLLLVMLTEVYGVKGRLGDLVLEPKLKKEQFSRSVKASVNTLFAGRELAITYINEAGLDYGEYTIVSITIDGESISYESGIGNAAIKRDVLIKLEKTNLHNIEVRLGFRS